MNDKLDQPQINQVRQAVPRFVPKRLDVPMLLMFPCAIIAMIVIALPFIETYRLEREGVTTMAQVVEQEWGWSGRGNVRANYSVVYQFQAALPDGSLGTYQGSGVFEDHQRIERELHTVKIWYLPSDPSVSRLDASNAYAFPTPVAYPLIVGVLGVLMLIFAGIGRRLMRRYIKWKLIKSYQSQ